jgi:hypothetical protein
MARSAPAFSSFKAGEVSPRMEGRVTLDTYREGLADMTNLLVLPQGGVTRRPGTEYLGEIKNSAQAARLIPFQFKTTDTYILEFGNQTMRGFPQRPASAGRHRQGHHRHHPGRSWRDHVELAWVL